MDNRDRTIALYTSQREEVVEIIRRTGCYFVRLEYIAKKYDIVKDVFLHAYRWYAGHAQQVVAKPEEAESGVWTFCDLKYLEEHQGSRILRLEVPVREAVFFRMSDWSSILNMRYLGETAAEAEEFTRMLERQGIRDESEVCLKPYYPQLKTKLTASWDRLFRFDEAVKQGADIPYDDMQAGLWCIREEWVREIY